MVSLLRIYLQPDEFPIRCAKYPSINFRKDLFCRISEDRDSNRSSLYEVPSSDGAVGVPLIVGMPGCLCCPPQLDEIPLAIPKLWLCVTRALLAVPLQEMAIPAWAVNSSPDNDVRNCFRLVG